MTSRDARGSTSSATKSTKTSSLKASTSPAGAIGPADRVFVVSGFSKTYAMTGWRLGWLVCPQALAPPQPGCRSPSPPALPPLRKRRARRRSTAIRRAQGISKRVHAPARYLIDVFGNTGLLPAIPEGAFYALIDIGATGLSSLEFARDLLARCDTAVVPGITFGPSCDRYVRVAFTIADEELRDGLQRLRASYRKAERQNKIPQDRISMISREWRPLAFRPARARRLRPVQDRSRPGGAFADRPGGAPLAHAAHARKRGSSRTWTKWQTSMAAIPTPNAPC